MVLVGFALSVAVPIACGGSSVSHGQRNSGSGGSSGTPSAAGGATGGSSGTPGLVGIAPDPSAAGADGDTKSCMFASIATLCVVSDGQDGEDHFAPGDLVQVEVTPSRCYSRSCTDTYFTIEGIHPAEDAGPGNFYVVANLCLGPNDNAADPSSCSPCVDYPYRMTSQLPFIDGTNVVRLGGLEVTVEVPSTVPAGSLCAGLTG